NCEKAIKACQEAIKIFPFKDFPIDYAKTQNNLGIAYGILAKVKDRTKNCEKALKAYKEALKAITTRESQKFYRIVEKNLKRLLDFCGNQ
ncbi:MAG: tetratricopeptide repeat protein, partial [Promethearchaeota archaeon]